MSINISYVRGATPNELEYRRSIMESYIFQNHINITEWFIDISSGADLNRLGVQQMVQFVVNNQVDSLYIENVGLLGRNASRVIELMKDINDYSTRIYVVENGSHQEVDIKSGFPFF